MPKEPSPKYKIRRSKLRSPRLPKRADLSDLEYGERQIHLVCRLGGSPEFLDDARATLSKARVPLAIRTGNTAVLFAHLVNTFSFQGVSDAVAASYLRQHGGVSLHDIKARLDQTPSCGKLRTYWNFHGCDYRKAARTCAIPGNFTGCPLPDHSLRNGKLNQMAYSLFLFIRDVTDNDLVGWIDRQLASGEGPGFADSAAEKLVQPMCEIFGVSDKVVTMALSDLLLVGGQDRPLWKKAGASMIVIDTLVHNFLHRCGVLHRAGSLHAVGEACYRPHGCASIIRSVAQKIDARAFNPAFPTVFPRFVQHAIWRYCAQSGFDVCNGNRINDQERCNNVYCRLFETCDRMALASRN